VTTLPEGSPCSVHGDGWTVTGVVVDAKSPVCRLVRYTPPGAEAARVDWFDHFGGPRPPGKRLADNASKPVRISAEVAG